MVYIVQRINPEHGYVKGIYSTPGRAAKAIGVPLDEMTNEGNGFYAATPLTTLDGEIDYWRIVPAVIDQTVKYVQPDKDRALMTYPDTPPLYDGECELCGEPITESLTPADMSAMICERCGNELGNEE